MNSLPAFSGNSWSLYHGDCMQLLSQVDDGSVDYIITSPPYNLSNTSGGGFPSTKMGKWYNVELAKGYENHRDNMPREEYRKWQADFLSLAWQKINETGAIFYNHKPRVQNGLLETPLDWNPGLPVRQIIIWKRAGGINFSPSFYLPTHEWIVVFAKPKFRLKSKGASGVGDVWEIAQEKSPYHPAPFPLALPNKILSTVKPCGRKVIDPFCGSGTTGAAAITNGFEFMGFDNTLSYLEFASKRLETCRNQKKTEKEIALL